MIEYNQEKREEIHNNFVNKFKMFYHDFMTSDKKDDIKIPTNDVNVLYELKGFVESKITGILETDDQVKQQEKSMANVLVKNIDKKILDQMVVLNKSSGLKEPILIIEEPKDPKEIYFSDKHQESKDILKNKKPAFFKKENNSPKLGF